MSKIMYKDEPYYGDGIDPVTPLIDLPDYQTTGSVDKELYDGLNALGWLSECFANGKLKLKKTLDNVLDKLNTINNDTGWISLIPYLNTGYAGRSTDVNHDHCPAYRIYNNVVYFKGFIYSTTAKNSKSDALCKNIPSEIRTTERGGGSVRFQGSAYHIRVEAANLNVYDTSNIGVQSSYQGYHLSCLSYILNK